MTEQHSLIERMKHSLVKVSASVQTYLINRSRIDYERLIYEDLAKRLALVIIQNRSDFISVSEPEPGTIEYSLEAYVTSHAELERLVKAEFDDRCFVPLVPPPIVLPQQQENN